LFGFLVLWEGLFFGVKFDVNFTSSQLKIVKVLVSFRKFSPGSEASEFQKLVLFLANKTEPVRTPESHFVRCAASHVVVVSFFFVEFAHCIVYISINRVKKSCVVAAPKSTRVRVCFSVCGVQLVCTILPLARGAGRVTGYQQKDPSLLPYSVAMLLSLFVGFFCN